MIELPDKPEFHSATWRLRRVISITESSFTGRTQHYEHPGRWWEAELSLPSMTMREWGEWESFLLSARGGVEKFRLGNPQRGEPIGKAAGNPVVANVGNPPYVEMFGGELNGGDILEPDGSFTVELLINVKDLPSVESVLMSKYDETYEKGFKITLGHDGAVSFSIPTTSPDPRPTASIVSEGKFIRLTFRWDEENGIKTILKNGEVIAEDTGVSGSYEASGEDLICVKDFNGIVDDIRLWDYAVPDEDVKSKVALEHKGSENGLEGLFLMNEGENTTLNNSAGSGSLTVSMGAWIPKMMGYIYSNNWASDIDDQLLPGDYIEVNKELKAVINKVSSSTAGTATIKVEPFFRENVEGLEEIITEDPRGIFEVAERDVSWDMRTVVTEGITIPVREAV